jgi:two-component system, chemotaxis family, sensor kinase CheA
MVPVSGLFRKMIRLVYDLSSKCGKKVNLESIGEENIFINGHYEP